MKNPNGKPETKVLKLTELQQKFPLIQWKKFIEIYLGSGFTLEDDASVMLLDDFYFENIFELVKTIQPR
jgi:hypothetical protein